MSDEKAIQDEISIHAKLREVWDSGQSAVNAWLAIPSPITAELISRQGFDAVTIDLQHGLADYSDALAMLQAMTASDVTPMARVPWLEPGIIMKLLDAGATGLICPMVNSAEDAENFVHYANYAPRGGRSFGPTRANLVYGSDYFENANNEVVTLAMIETVEALENLESIVKTPNLTGVYIGPSDLSLSMGYQPKLDHDEPAVLEAIEIIRGKAHEAGIRACIHCLSGTYARQMIDQGFDLVTLASDLRLLTRAAADAVADVRR